MPCRPFPRRLFPLLAIPAVLSALLAAPLPAMATVVRVHVNFYSLDDGRSFRGPWDIAQELIAARETAIVVMEAKANQELVQMLLQTLEEFKIPTLFTKAADFKELVARGVIVPKPPTKP